MRKELRLRKNEEFQKVRAYNRYLKNSAFVLYFCPKKEDHARFGLSVSKKNGNAVVRNKIKRQLRMMIQQLVPFDAYPYDVIVIVRKVYLQQDYSTNKKALEMLLNKAII